MPRSKSSKDPRISLVRSPRSNPVVWIGLATSFALAGCVATPSGDTGGPSAPQTGRRLAYTMDAAPAGAPPGSCWAWDVAPAVVETITKQVQVRAAIVNADGSVAAPAIWRTETRQKILSARQELNFQTPCGVDLSAEFLASLQRALGAREIYQGPVTGELNHATQQAIRRFQLRDGLNSSFLSLDGARRLGLSEVARDEGTE